jgi:hypothetical protein
VSPVRRTAGQAFAAVDRVVVSYIFACFTASAGGCTNVVNAGTVVASPQALDASSDPLRAPDRSLSPEELCTTTGGKIETRTCCDSTKDFASFCWNSSCFPCVMEPSQPTRMARLCICPMTECFTVTAFPMGCAVRVGAPSTGDAAAGEHAAAAATSSGDAGSERH